MNSNKPLEVTASIVLYKENFKELNKTIECFLKIPLKKKLFLVDNNPQKRYKDRFTHPNIVYVKTKKNIGFGAGHNLVISEIKNQSYFHLVLNPDVFFSEDVILNLMKELRKDTNLAMIAPKVLFPDGNHQYTARKFPTFFDLVIRRLGVFKERIKEYEYQHIDLNKPFFPNAVHGCFMLFKTDDFVALEGFDKRYFLYMEDIDICKRILASHKKILYYPIEEIKHIHRKGSAKKIKLLIYHFSSAVKYFIKWST